MTACGVGFGFKAFIHYKNRNESVAQPSFKRPSFFFHPRAGSRIYR